MLRAPPRSLSLSRSLALSLCPLGNISRRAHLGEGRERPSTRCSALAGDTGGHAHADCAARAVHPEQVDLLASLSRAERAREREREGVAGLTAAEIFEARASPYTHASRTHTHPHPHPPGAGGTRCAGSPCAARSRPTRGTARARARRSARSRRSPRAPCAARAAAPRGTARARPTAGPSAATRTRGATRARE